MRTDDGANAGFKSWVRENGVYKTVFGIVGVVAVGILAGLVFSRYEAAIPPAEAAPMNPQGQLIHVTVNHQDEVPGASRAHAYLEPAVAGPMCSADTALR
jgi:hypothetical protein